MNLSNSQPTTAAPKFPSTPRFSDFQFRTIGQQPDLLKRISEPNPSIQQDNYSYRSSRSRSSSLVPADQHHSSNQPAQNPMIAHPGRLRPSLLESLTGQAGVPNVIMTDFFISQSANSNNATHATNLTAVAHPTETLGKGTETYNANDNITRNLAASSPSPAQRDREMSSDMMKDISTQNGAAMSPSHSSTPEVEKQLTGPSPRSAASSPNHKEISLTSLRALQARLSSSIAVLTPISTTSVVLLAQSAKDQSANLLATAHRAHTLAQQAVSTAQESMEASKECLSAAEALQSRITQAMTALQQVSSGQDVGGQEWRWNETVQSLKADLHELGQWVTEREVQDVKRERQLEERKIESHSQQLVLRVDQRSRSNTATVMGSSSSGDSAVRRVEPKSLSLLQTAEHEANAATQAWNEHREQSAERKRLAAEELRRHREVELKLEQEKLRAQAQADAHEANLARLRLERIRAEQAEKASLQQETLEVERREKELEQARKETVRLHVDKPLVEGARAEAAEEENRRAAEVQKRKEEQRLAQLQAEQEHKRQELHEREELQKRLEAGKAKAHLDREQKLREEQELKRQQVMAEKHKAGAEAAAKILADRAKEKQVFHDSSAMSISPISPSVSLPVPQVAPQPQGCSGEVGNVVSKQTLVRTVSEKEKGRVVSGGSRVAGTAEHAHPFPTDAQLSAPSSSPAIDTQITLPLVVPPSTTETLAPRSPVGNNPSSLSQVVPQSHQISLPPSGTQARTNEASPSPTEGLTKFPDYSQTDSKFSGTFSQPTIPKVFNHHNITVHRKGQDAGNVPIVSSLRMPPVSPEAQQANLRPLIIANRTSVPPFIKPDPDGGEDILNSGRPTNNTRPTLQQPSLNGQGTPSHSASPSNVLPEDAPLSNLKVEPPADIPMLSLPSPQSIAHHDGLLGTTLLASKPKQRLPKFKKIQQTAPLAPVPMLMPPRTRAQHAAPAPSLLTSESPPSIPRPLGASPPLHHRPGGLAADTSKIVPVAGDVGIQLPPGVELYQDDVSSRIGPDAIATDSWTQPAHLDGDNFNPPKKAQWMKRRMNRSPPADTADHLQASRQRAPPPRLRGDHYSPPRRRSGSFSPRDDYLYQQGRARGSGSSGNSRAPSPTHTGLTDRRDGYHSPPPTDLPLIGRKRFREEESIPGPLNRRPRYEPSSPEGYTPLSVSQAEDKWSRPTAYRRSPSPLPWDNSLAQRMDAVPVNHKLRASAYRPDYDSGRQYLGSNDYRYPGNSSISLAPASTPAYHHPSASFQPNHQQQLAPPRSAPTDARPNLLDRFTNYNEPRATQQDQSYSTGNNPRPRGPPPRSRSSSGNPSLEHRLSRQKPALINRIQPS